MKKILLIILLTVSFNSYSQIIDSSILYSVSTSVKICSVIDSIIPNADTIYYYDTNGKIYGYNFDNRYTFATYCDNKELEVIDSLQTIIKLFEKVNKLNKDLSEWQVDYFKVYKEYESIRKKYNLLINRINNLNSSYKSKKK